MPALGIYPSALEHFRELQPFAALQCPPYTYPLTHKLRPGGSESEHWPVTSQSPSSTPRLPRHTGARESKQRLDPRVLILFGQVHLPVSHIRGPHPLVRPPSPNR